jgi:hypothetical protein
MILFGELFALWDKLSELPGWVVALGLGGLYIFGMLFVWVFIRGCYKGRENDDDLPPPFLP